MTQILVSTVALSFSTPVDPNKPDGTLETLQSPAINEVVGRIPDGRIASVNGDDINITPDTIIGGGNLNHKIVEVSAESIPDDFKPNSYLYDGSSWSVNPNYAKLRVAPSSE